MYILNIRETKKSTSLINTFGKSDINLYKYLLKSHTVTVEVTRDWKVKTEYYRDPNQYNFSSTNSGA